MSFRSLPFGVKSYIVFLWIAGLAATLMAAGFPWFRSPDTSLLIYLFIVLGTAQITVKFPYTDIHFSLDSPFVFLILILYGPLPAIVADAIAKLVITLAHAEKTAWYKIPFNVSSGALAIFGAYLAFDKLQFGTMDTSAAFMLPILGLVLCNFFVATITVATAICIIQKENLIVFWYNNFLPSGIGFVASGAIATLLFILDGVGSYLGFFVSVPLIGLIYFSQKVYSQKETEAKSHISELETMHLSSIQSLSLALDAKDGYTHGHVHRVSRYAVGLAKRLGVTDPKILKAIAFAGLVHDIGKIAVPDAILNKPGKYTDAEFNRMKIHPVISAEILKTIPLPFPVAKLVRHHHEKWNGRGYPDGLAGTEIPFESRILAVADVFDAIRSDRPYRPKMEKARAVKIMECEKGNTLDPALTDVFLEHLDELENELNDNIIQVDDSNIQDIVKASYLAYEQEVEDSEELQNRRARQEATLFNVLSDMSVQGKSLTQRLQTLASAIAKIVPHTVLVVYLPHGDSHRLEPVLISGNDTGWFAHNSMDEGVGISGWVYANGSAMISNPPKTEFPGFKDQHIPYRSVLSFPIGVEERAIGAVTLYSENTKAFSEEHKQILSKISPLLVSPIKDVIDKPKAIQPLALRPVVGESH